VSLSERASALDSLHEDETQIETRLRHLGNLVGPAIHNSNTFEFGGRRLWLGLNGTEASDQMLEVVRRFAAESRTSCGGPRVDPGRRRLPVGQGSQDAGSDAI
jgi:hypothetical protein